jgi:mannose-6-phosphate isomerase-like protein (cupin superfamily)
MGDAIDLSQKLSTFADHWSPRTVAQFNAHDVMVVKVQGEFVWHKHDDTDDFFLVLKGVLDIQMRDRTVTLKPGQMYIVPKGVEHRPVARLFDSHIAEPQGGAQFDAMESFEPEAHGFWPWLAVVAVPSAQSCNDPGGEGQRTFWVHVLLPLGLAFQFCRDGLDDGLIGRIEDLEQGLAGGAVARLDQLHHRYGRDGDSSGEADHDLGIADVGCFNIEASGLLRVEVLFDDPAHPIKLNDAPRFGDVCHGMGRQ